MAAGGPRFIVNGKQGGTRTVAENGPRKFTTAGYIPPLGDDERRSILDAWNATNGSTAPIPADTGGWAKIIAGAAVATPFVNIAANGAVTFTAS